MSATRALLAVALALIPLGSEAAVPVTVNFDLDPFGVAIPDGTVINEVYAPLGIHFTAIGPGSCTNPPEVYASSNQPAGFGSAPNVVTVCAQPFASDFSEDFHGMIQATFDQDVVRVCVDVNPIDAGAFAVLRSYDGGGGLLSEVFSTPGVRSTLCVGAGRIRRVEFSGSGIEHAQFDNFVIEYGDAFSIDFDLDTNGVPVAPGTVVNDLYQPWGVTFAAVGSGELCGPDVYASDNHPGDFGSPGNLVSTCSPPTASDISEERFKTVEASFDPPACAVCIEVRPDDSADQAFLRAYDASGDLIGEAISQPGVIEQLCLADLVMHSVQFNGYQDRFARFDDLSYIVTSGVVDVPEGVGEAATLRIESITPNPSRHTAHVRFRAALGRPTILQVVDVSGRTRAMRWVAGSDAASQSIEIGSGLRLPPGVYWIRLAQDERIVSRKWVLVE